MSTNKIRVMNLIWSMGAGGAQQVLINYLRDFKNDPDIDFKLYVYTKPTDSKYDREIKENHYNVEYLNNPQTKIQIPYFRRFFQQPISKAAWKKAIHDFQPDIVHVHISALLSSTMSGIISENIPIRFDTLHSCPYRYKGKEKQIIVDAFQNHNLIPICVTEEQVLQAKECYGITDYEVVHNGVDLETIRGKCCSRKNAREEFDLPEEAFVVIGVGRLNPIKRFDLLLEAFAEVCRNKENTILLIAGDGKEKKKLISKAKALGIADRVRFLGSITDVTKLYCAADVLAVTSESESSSLVAIEAQACGTRCVLSAGVPKESVLLKNTQRLADGASANDWCKALLDDSYEGVPWANMDDYEVHSMSKKMREVYLKYFLKHREKNHADSE